MVKFGDPAHVGIHLAGDALQVHRRTARLLESLHQELRDSPIDVVIMQPVAMFMERGDTGSHLSLLPGVSEDSHSHAIVRKMSKDTAASTLTPEMVAEKICDVLQTKKKPLRVPMNKTKAIGLARRVAPQFLWDKLIAEFAG